KYQGERIYLSSTHAEKFYNEIEFQKGDFIMFGRESSGVPEEVHNKLAGMRIPMIETSTRSLNISNTVSIVAYEALRQMGFPNMK
ncbi:MAG: TrmH family RNA methyltransferase, partial [Clostridiaceae bacterium]